MPRKRREDLIELTRKKILDAARQLMAERGAARLSLREIARSIDMTAPGLYYYFASLDALITVLVLDAFNAMADALEAARNQVLAGGGTTAEALYQVCLEYRAWAVGHAIDFELIYGTPIPGYHAPEAMTTPAAARSGEVFGKLLYAAILSGELRPPPPYSTVPPPMQDHLRAYYHDANLDEAIMHSAYLTAVGWPQLHGIVMLELFEHIQPLVGDVEEFYRQQVMHMMRTLGIAVSATS